LTDLTPEQLLLRDADRCVMCGMCLPHCPTYRLSGDEAQSPRGRISIIQGLARGQLQPDAPALAHLDQCLLCRACERMCPSEVQYGKLMVGARRLYQPGKKHAAADRTVEALTEGRLPRGLARFYQRSGLRSLARATGLLKVLGLDRADRMLPALERSRPLPEHVPARGAERGKVALFTGCTGELFEPGALHGAAELLSRWGYSVRIPGEQACCGAMDQHAGERDRFEALARRNLAAFADPEEMVVFIASGCGALLTGYAQWLQEPEAEAFSARVREISDFLSANADGPALRPLPEKVAIHVPCSQKNVLKAPNAARKLLEHIPRVQLVALPNADLCCGAAGHYVLDYPETADALRERQLEGLEGTGARYLVSTNVGCALHLAAGARERGLEVEILHPVELLARQLA